MNFSIRSGLLIVGLLMAFQWTCSAFGQEASDLCPTRPTQEFVEERCVNAIDEALQSGDEELLAKLLDNLTLNYRREGRDDDAIATLQRRIDLTQPDLPHNATTELAKLLVKSGRPGEASSLLASLIDQNQGQLTRGETWLRGDAELQLARIYAGMEDWDLAERYFQHSIEDLSRGPGAAPARDAVVGLIKLYIEQGRTKEALETCLKWEETLETGPPRQTDPCKGLAVTNNDQGRR